MSGDQPHDGDRENKNRENKNGNTPENPKSHDDLGGGWLTEPADSNDDLGSFLRNSIPGAGNNYWQSIDDRLDQAGASTTDDELTRALPNLIPSPRSGYWETIDGRLAAVERERPEETLDTGTGVVRPMTMNKTGNSRTKGSRILIAAAALVVLAGLGVVAAVTRGGSNDADIDLATQPEVTATVGAVASEGAESAAPATPTLIPALATMQSRLAGDQGDTEALFCFAAADTLVVPIEDPAPGMAVAQLSVQPNGSYSLLALQDDTYLIFAAGEGRTDGVLETTPTGISGLSPQLPPYLVTLTDSSIAFSPEAVLPLVSCADVAPQVQTMQALIEAGRDRAGQAAPDEDPRTALRARSISPGVNQASAPYCFTGVGVQRLAVQGAAPDRAAIELTIDSNGFIEFLGAQGGLVLSGSGAGHPDGQLIVTLISYADAGAVQTTVELLVGEQSVTLDDAVLDLVPCGEVTYVIEPTRGLVANASVAVRPATEPGLAPIPNDQLLSSAGLGPVQINMLVSEVEADLGIDLAIATLEADDLPGRCGIITSLDADVLIIVETTGDGDGIVRRVSTRSDRWATPSGIRVGVSQQQVIDAFPGQLTMEPHVYVQDGRYLRFIPNDPTSATTVEFVTEFDVVAEIRAGANDWVGLAEGCA